LTGRRESSNITQELFLLLNGKQRILTMNNNAQYLLSVIRLQELLLITKHILPPDNGFPLPEDFPFFFST